MANRKPRKLRQSQRRWCRMIYVLRSQTLSARAIASSLGVATDTVCGVIRRDTRTHILDAKQRAAVIENHRQRSRTFSQAEMAARFGVDVKTIKRAVNPDLAARLNFEHKLRSTLGPRRNWQSYDQVSV